VSEPLVLAIDQGTSATKALLVDAAGTIVARGSAPLEQQAPRAGWVEHRADDVITSMRTAIDEVLRACAATGGPAAVTCIGISNQRESMLLWDRETGEAVSPLLSWQDRRTIDRCAALTAAGHGPSVRRISGLPLDPMFSAVKAAWLLDTYDRDRAQASRLCLGTVDSWLLWHLVGDHVIESGNASRTSLVDLSTGDWSDELLDIFGIPRAVLPRIIDSSGPIGAVRGFGDLEGVPVTGVLGDSHAALFAHAGWRPGVVKATYGTGSSLMTRADDAAGDVPALCRTIAWRLPGERPTVAYEANILSAGSTLTWLAGVLGTTVPELALEAADSSAGVCLVPAFNGLGAPWWDPSAQAVVVGLSLATTRGNLARAALDSVVLQVADVVASMAAAGVHPAALVVDGGMTANTDLMRRQSALCGVPVRVSRAPELSALGAAHAAGLGAGVWSMPELESLAREYDTLEPVEREADVARLLENWNDALTTSRMATEGRY
jgi:glycerol kinase